MLAHFFVAERVTQADHHRFIPPRRDLRMILSL
jgi:hypothetical protein